MNKKRLMIYYASTSNEKLELYSEFFLNKFSDCFCELIMVFNETEKVNALSDKDFNELLSSKTVSVISVERGMHCLSAYYAGILEVEVDRLIEFDEIICVSDEVMGPVGDFTQLFETMDNRNSDVWSIAKQHPTPLNYLDYTGNNLQNEYMLPFFLVLKTSVIKDERIKELFRQVATVEPYRQSLVDAKALFLSSKLKELGYSWDVYLQTEDIKKMYYNPLLFIPTEMLANRDCPIFLKESFIGNYDSMISNVAGQATVKLYEYLKSETDYDVDMIWDTILKTGHQQDINHNMHLNYIFSDKRCDAQKLAAILKVKKIALVMHLYFPDLLSESLKYARSMPESCDVYITTDTLEKKKEIETCFKEYPCNKLEVRLIENRGRDVSSLLTGVKDVIMNYDYVCFVHDKKSAQVIPGSMGHDFGYQCFENLLGSKNFVANIICAFYDEKRLGMLSPIYPAHGNYFSVNGDFDWGGNYDITMELAKQLKLTVPICREKSPVAPLGTMFWFRPEALKILYDCDWEYNDFPKEPNGTDATLLHAVERIYSYVTQQQGFYPAIVSNELFANISLTNLTNFLQGINRTSKKCKGFVSYQQLLYVLEVLGYESQEAQLLRQENERLCCENESLQTQIEKLMPQTSLKWQVKDRTKKLLHIKKEETE